MPSPKDGHVDATIKPFQGNGNRGDGQKWKRRGKEVLKPYYDSREGGFQIKSRDDYATNMKKKKIEGKK